MWSVAVRVHSSFQPQGRAWRYHVKTVMHSWKPLWTPCLKTGEECDASKVCIWLKHVPSGLVLGTLVLYMVVLRGKVETWRDEPQRKVLRPDGALLCGDEDHSHRISELSAEEAIPRASLTPELASCFEMRSLPSVHSPPPRCSLLGPHQRPNQWACLTLDVYFQNCEPSKSLFMKLACPRYFVTGTENCLHYATLQKSIPI